MSTEDTAEIRFYDVTSVDQRFAHLRVGHFVDRILFQVVRFRNDLYARKETIFRGVATESESKGSDGFLFLTILTRLALF